MSGRSFFPLYAIVDVECAARAGWPPRDLAAAYLRGGARLLQLRAKTLPSGELAGLAAEVTELAHRAGSVLIVNDRADVARLAGADGVHVGQRDLPPEAVRSIVGEAAVVGLSTRTPAEIDAALAAPISYVAVGPVFGSTTKEGRAQPVGLDRVRYAAGRAAARGLPVVAIGGITLERAREVLAAGAASVAVIADLLTAGDPEARVRAYVADLAGYNAAAVRPRSPIVRF